MKIGIVEIKRDKKYPDQVDMYIKGEFIGTIWGDDTGTQFFTACKSNVRQCGVHDVIGLKVKGDCRCRRARNASGG